MQSISIWVGLLVDTARNLQFCYAQRHLQRAAWTSYIRATVYLPAAWECRQRHDVHRSTHSSRHSPARKCPLPSSAKNKMHQYFSKICLFNRTYGSLSTHHLWGYPAIGARNAWTTRKTGASKVEFLAQSKVRNHNAHFALRIGQRQQYVLWFYIAMNWKGNEENLNNEKYNIDISVQLTYI